MNSQDTANKAKIAPRQLAAADLRVGDQVARRRVKLDSGAFDAFSALSGDAHPIHYDPEYANDKGLRAPIAHGLLLLAVTALGATALSDQLHDSMIAMLGVQARYLSPVFVGDEIDIVFHVAAIEPKSQNRSIVTFNIEVSSIADGTSLVSVIQHYLMKTTFIPGNP